MARRRMPARRRTRRRTTRKGMVRKTARRAYMRRRAPVRRVRKRKRNPRPIFASPAFRFAAYGVAGAAASVVLNNQLQAQLNQAGPGNAPALAAILKPELGGARLHAGVMGSLATILIASMPRLKANTRANLIALGVGMLTEPTINVVQRTVSGVGAIESAGAEAIQTQRSPIVARLRAAQAASASNGMNSANTYNSAAALVGVPVSA